MYQNKDFLKDVFNNNYLKRTYQENLPNLLEELFYSIYIMNPDNSFNSPFNTNNKRDALHYIEEYLLSNGYDYTHLGLDEKELFDNYYDEFMQIIETSLKIEIDGRLTTITSRSLDPIEARIWYKVNEYKFIEYIDKIVNKIERERNEAKIAYHLRNIFRVKARSLMDGIQDAQDLMRSDSCNTWQEIFNKYKRNPKMIIEASMRGRGKIDRYIKDALEKNWISSKSNRFYREWCKILGVEYKKLLEFL